MRPVNRILLILFFLISFLNLYGQNYSTERTVQISVNTNTQPAYIELSWINDGTADSFKVYRRPAYSSEAWGNPLAEFSSAAESFRDNNVNSGDLYEYQIIKYGTFQGYGYVVSGMEYMPPFQKGRLILVIEDSYLNEADFSGAIQQTINDLEMDGWEVKRIDVNKDDDIRDVKEKIDGIYYEDPSNTKALYLIGKVPVPYSGLLNPDNHANHKGAWPTDSFYATFDGTWTDNEVNINSSDIPERIRNIPADGKFDQSVIPADVKLQTGRIDFSRLYTIGKTEKEMLVAYLHKAHLYKTGELTAGNRALVDDNFLGRSAGFASSGYRNFAPFFGPDNIHTDVDFVQGTKIGSGNSFMWAYGCGGGSYQSCSGVASVEDFANNDLQIIFTMLFGSYFGDWDSDNNLMRAALSQGHTLNAAWSARPHWHFYHMAMGESIGYSALLTQNNSGDYYSGGERFNRNVHITLLGDPTFRMHYVKPPSNPDISQEGNLIQLSWEGSDQNIEGYNLYRLDPQSQDFVKLNNEIISGSFYTDDELHSGGTYEYIIKSVSLQNTSSGTYFNESLGVKKAVNFVPDSAAETKDYSTEMTVQLWAEVSKNPAEIVLRWINDGTADSYLIYRRDANSESSWNAEIELVQSSGSSYSDTNVDIGKTYEYQVIKNGENKGYGYVVSGIETKLHQNKGILILVTENSFLNEADFRNAIDQTVDDIQMDGWQVKQIEVNRNDNPVDVKQKISNIYSEDPHNTKSLYLIGHVPVPYSGLINPDHHSDHLGAWPADVYYGTFEGEWTDVLINEHSDGIDERIRNIPGDGKFDQSYLPADVELEIGRIDFSGQYLFEQNEKELLINYLEKAHQYKTGAIKVTDRSLVDDNFFGRSEGFASSGYRNFAPLTGPDNIHSDADFVEDTKINGGSSFLWAYGAGSGSYQSATGVATTEDFATNDLQIIFTMIFGSYSGDWDSDNNLLRASLARGYTLSTAWAGRPYWHFYHMGMGKNIGYSAKLTQNNDGNYFPGTRPDYNRMVHIALLGDPTLRMKYPEPPSSFNLYYESHGNILQWNAPAENITGYNIYRKHEADQDYTLLNSDPLKETSYVDENIPKEGKYEYLVKTVRLENNTSGSYFNESLGVKGSIDSSSDNGFSEHKSFAVYPNPVTDILNIKLPEESKGSMKIQIYDFSGREHKSIISSNYTDKITLDVSPLPAGVYFISVSNSKEILYKKKFIIL